MSYKNCILKTLAAAIFAIMPYTAAAQYDVNTENGIVSLANRDGFSIKSKNGDFI